MKKIIILLTILCLSVFIQNISFAEKDSALTEEQRKEIQAFTAHINKLSEAKEYSMACAMAHELTRRYPNEPIGYVLLGLARMESGYYEAAIKAFDDCIKVDDHNVNGYVYRGVTKMQMGKYKEAEKDYNIVINMDVPIDDKVFAYSNRAATRYAGGNYKGAIKDYTTIIDIQPKLNTLDSVYYNRGKCYFELEDTLNADVDYKKAIELNPKAKYLTYEKQKEKEVKQERVRKSGLTLAQMREVNKLGDEVETAIEKRRYKKALTLANKFLEKYPTQPDAVFAVAKASNYVGNTEKAIEYYTKCYEMDKTYYRAILNRGTVRYNKKDYKGAIKDFSLTIKITKYEHETVAQAYGNRAVAKYFSGNLKGALKDYNKVFEIEPNLPNIGQIHFNRGLCRYDLGDKVGADEDFNTAKKLNPKRKYIYYDQRG